MDTENSYKNLPHEGNLAFLTFCDVATRIVLLWRVHKMSNLELKEVQKVVNEVRRTRRFASFGPERFFSLIRNVQYNRPDGSLISLKDAVFEQVGLHLDKSETILMKYFYE